MRTARRAGRESQRRRRYGGEGGGAIAPKEGNTRGRSPRGRGGGLSTQGQAQAEGRRGKCAMRRRRPPRMKKPWKCKAYQCHTDRTSGVRKPAAAKEAAH